MSYLEQVDKTRVPRHVAIIMDGNGRWATSQGMDRTMGHQAGAQKSHEIMETAVKLGLDYLTLYTFSTENWNRPLEEIAALMSLLLKHLEEELFMKYDARFTVVGDIQRLPENVQEAIRYLENRTKNNKATCMVLALSYSSRWEIVEACKKLAAQAAAGQIQAESIDDDMVSKAMATASMPDPDLLIRTAGDLRISNFLLWQIAYSELYFTPKFWPDFTKEDFCEAIVDYQSRERRFGKTSEQLK